MDRKAVLYGVDVASREVVAARFDSTGCQSIPNKAQALSQWLESLPAQAHIALEATGCYHQLLASLAHARGLKVFVLNPRELKSYARAVGLRAKTDRVDAQLIARYLHRELDRLRPWAPPHPAQSQLSNLLARRQELVSARVSLEQSLASLAQCTRERNALFRRLRGLIEKLEQLIVQQIGQQPHLQGLYQRLLGITGVGPIVAAELANVLGHLSFKRVDSFIAFAGLDPRPEDSGQHRGRRKLSKQGCPRLRRALYLAAFAACHSKLLGPFYRALRPRFASTQALIILARRIARIAYAVARSGQPFDPTKIPAIP